MLISLQPRVRSCGHYFTDEKNESEKKINVMSKAMEFSDELKLTSTAFQVNRL